MIIINSAAYVGNEFQAELGVIPPAFLPVGNKRLYEIQTEGLKKIFPDEQVFLTIPESFDILESDGNILKEKSINLIKVPAKLSLAESLLFSINLIGVYSETLRVLHGDTFLNDFPQENNFLAVASSHDNYVWESDGNSSLDVWAGCFAFSNIPILARELAGSRGDFVKAVRSYDKDHPLTRCKVEDWLDFGHVNNYYKSRSRITTQRAFNQIKISDGIVKKRGVPDRKICGEAKWLSSLPVHLKKYAPQLINFNENIKSGSFYEIEYVCAIPLNEAYVHGLNPLPFWQVVFDHCHKWFVDATDLKLCELPAEELIYSVRDSLIFVKTKERISKYFSDKKNLFSSTNKLNGKLLPSLEVVVNEMLDDALVQKPVAGVMHGDMCFSNMLYDTRSDRLKLIDPRGINDAGEFILYGDVTYDLAKLAHSVIGLYDFIIAGRYQLYRIDTNYEFSIDVDSRILSIQEYFIKSNFLNGLSNKQIVSQVVLLFLSMLPLHDDRPDRQEAFIANALRIYSEYFG